MVCRLGSVVGIVTGYGLDGPGIESWWGRDCPHLPRPALVCVDQILAQSLKLSHPFSLVRIEVWKLCLVTVTAIFIYNFHMQPLFSPFFQTQLVYNDGSKSETVIEVNLRHPGKHDRNVVNIRLP